MTDPKPPLQLRLRVRLSALYSCSSDPLSASQEFIFGSHSNPHALYQKFNPQQKFLLLKPILSCVYISTGAFRIMMVANERMNLKIEESFTDSTLRDAKYKAAT